MKVVNVNSSEVISGNYECVNASLSGNSGGPKLEEAYTVHLLVTQPIILSPCFSHIQLLEL